MPHFRVDDAIHSHPKAEKAGDEALGLWTRAGAYSMAYGTDGFVPEWWVKRQPRGMVKARRLMDAVMWHPAERNGEKGFQFHQWRQDSKDKIEADREKARQRKARQRDSHRESRRDTTRDTPCESQRTSGYVPKTHTPSVVNFGGDVTQAAPSEPPPCNDHPEDPEKPCRRCKRRREWEQEQDELLKKAAAQDRVQQRRMAVKTQLACPDCDEYGWLIGDFEPPEKCSRHPIVKPEAV